MPNCYQIPLLKKKYLLVLTIQWIWIVGASIKACRDTGRHIVALEADKDIFNEVLMKLDPPAPSNQALVQPATAENTSTEETTTADAEPPISTNSYIARKRLKKLALE